MAAFDTFLGEYGMPQEPIMPQQDLLRELRDKVPTQLIELWQRTGFTGFANGIVWITNPKALQDPVSEWEPGKAMPIPVVRTAFGKVVYWHADKFTLLDPNHNDRFEAGDNVELLFDLFLVGKDARIGILQEPLFKKALKKFGPLDESEMYGYKLPLVLGGVRDLKNMEKMKIREQLSILAQAHQ